MFKSSVAFLFAASLLCAAQNSQPASQTQSSPSQPTTQVPEQQQSQPAPAATTPDQQKTEPVQEGPWKKIRVIVPRKSEPDRIPTGTLDKPTPV